MRKFKNQIFSLVLSGVLAITTVGFINQPAVNNTVKADEIKETVSILSGLKVVDYSAYTGRYMLHFNEEEQLEGYNIYVDGKDVPIKTVKKTGEYISAKELSKFGSGTHTMYVSNTDKTGSESPMISTKFEISGQSGNNTEIPQIYIDTNKSISNEYHEKADVTVSVFW